MARPSYSNLICAGSPPARAVDHPCPFGCCRLGWGCFAFVWAKLPLDRGASRCHGVPMPHSLGISTSELAQRLRNPDTSHVCDCNDWRCVRPHDFGLGPVRIIGPKHVAKVREMHCD